MITPLGTVPERGDRMCRKRVVAALIAVLILLAFVGSYWLLLRSPYPTAEAALEAFYTEKSYKECMVANPLRAHGKDVVPLVIRDLPNRTMPGRRYAISFLGEGKYSEALPALEAIALDETERNYIRADALEAIYQFLPARALALARQIGSQSYPDDKHGHLKRTIEEIERGEVRALDRRCW